MSLSADMREVWKRLTWKKIALPVPSIGFDIPTGSWFPREGQYELLIAAHRFPSAMQGCKL